MRKRPPMHSIPGPCPPHQGQILLVYRDTSVGGCFLFLFSFLSRYRKARVLYCDGPCVILLLHPGVLSTWRGTGLLSTPLGPHETSPCGGRASEESSQPAVGAPWEHPRLEAPSCQSGSPGVGWEPAAGLTPQLLSNAVSFSPPGFRGSCLSPATPSRRRLGSRGTAAPSTTGSCRSPWALLPPAPLRDSSRSTMTLSTSMAALACPVPPATASSPPWASSRSPGTTALTQVGVSRGTARCWVGSHQ